MGLFLSAANAELDRQASSIAVSNKLSIRFIKIPPRSRFTLIRLGSIRQRQIVAGLHIHSQVIGDNGLSGNSGQIFHHFGISGLL